MKVSIRPTQTNGRTAVAFADDEQEPRRANVNREGTLFYQAVYFLTKQQQQ
jgi:hypothetical protein